MATSATTVSEVRPPSGVRTSFLARAFSGDTLAYTITFLAATAILILTALLVLELWIHANPARSKFGWSFLTTTTWDPLGGNLEPFPSFSERW